MKPFKVGRVAMTVISDVVTRVVLYSNGHQFVGNVSTAGAVDWARLSFPNALITLRDVKTGSEPDIVIQERS